jgi:hypothetical protein
MEYSESEQRAFYRRQAIRFLELADGCKNAVTTAQLMKGAEYYLDKLAETAPGDAVAA